MTKLIIDANQSGEFRAIKAPASCRPPLILQPLVWAEILSSPPEYATADLDAIAQHDVRFGKELDVLYSELRNSTESEITELDTVFTTDSPQHDYLMKMLKHPTHQWIERAKEVKKLCKWAGSIRERFARYERQNQERLARGEKLDVVTFNNADEAFEYLMSNEKGAFRIAFMEEVTQGHTLPIKAKSENTLFKALLKNKRFVRFFRLYSTIVFGYAECWSDGQVNVPVSDKRDDPPDILNVLYADDGDLILTDDKKLKRALIHSEPRAPIKTCTWKEYVESQ